MTAYADTGDRAAEVDAYHRLSNLLKDELGTGSSLETEAVCLELLD